MRLKDPPDCFLSFAEVAELIGISETIIRHGECGTNELTRIKLGRRTVFSFNGVQEWMARRIKQAQEAQQKSQLAKLDLLDKKAEQFRRKQFMKGVVLQVINGGRKNDR